MNNKQIRNELLYQITMNHLKELLEKKVISIDEYKKMNEEFKKKYTPKTSVLFYDIGWYNLIYTSFRVIYSNDKIGGY